jgi:(p)ppGpp synthase/HD superfamily hydrolase
MAPSHLEHAFGLAFRAHAGQVDKLGEPYIAHVVRVAAAVNGFERQCTALLHDIVEDTQVTLSDLAASFPSEIVDAVDAITKRPSEDYEAYLARVAANPVALDVKRADMADNSAPRRLAGLAEADRRRLEEKYDKATSILSNRGVNTAC